MPNRTQDSRQNSYPHLVQILRLAMTCHETNESYSYTLSRKRWRNCFSWENPSFLPSIFLPLILDLLPSPLPANFPFPAKERWRREGIQFFSTKKLQRNILVCNGICAQGWTTSMAPYRFISIEFSQTLKRRPISVMWCLWCNVMGNVGVGGGSIRLTFERIYHILWVVSLEQSRKLTLM